MRIALIATLLAVSAPAIAGGSNGASPDPRAAATAQGTQTAKADDAERKICKRVDATESRLAAKRVCLTAREWKDRDEQTSRSW